MKTLLWFAVAVFLCMTARAQSSTRYYKDAYLSKEVAKEKAKFQVVVTRDEHNNEIETVTDLRTMEVVSVTRGGEPMGKVKISSGRGGVFLDYQFELLYNSDSCPAGSYEVADQPFEDNSAISYLAPRLEGENSVTNLLFRNLRYPRYALENNVQGRVVLRLHVDARGTIGTSLWRRVCIRP